MVSLGQVAIDMPAGPSEVEVIADETANPRFVAADLLSQAEHGADSQALLITSCPDLAEQVNAEVERQLDELSRRELTAKSLAHSKIIVVRDFDDVVEITNEYAPEHLIIQTNCPREVRRPDLQRWLNLLRALHTGERRRLCERDEPHTAHKRLRSRLQRGQPRQFPQENDISGDNPRGSKQHRPHS